MEQQVDYLTAWGHAIRPKTLFASIAPVLIGTFSVAKMEFHFSFFLLSLLFALFLQIGTNLANDYYDFLKGSDTKERKGPPRVCQKGWIDPQEVKMGFALSFLISFFLSIPLMIEGGWIAFFIMIFAISAGLLYTAGPFPLAHLGLGDVFVLIFFGPVASLGSSYLQTHAFSFTSLIGGVGAGLLSCAILVVNHLRDVEEDTGSGKKTLVVRFGPLFGKGEYFLCLAMSLILPFYVLDFFFAAILFAVGIKLSYSLYLLLQKEEYHPLLFKTSQFLIIYSFLFSMGAALS